MNPAPLALQRFADKWSHPDYPPHRVDGEDIAMAEHQLGRLLPEAYVRAVAEVGLPRPTLSLLTSVIEADAGFGDVSDFFSPAEIVEYIDDWRTETVPAAFVAFANNCMGDRYGFLCPSAGSARPADGAVLFLDHETGEVEEVAESFLDWLLDYNQLPFVHHDDA